MRATALHRDGLRLPGTAAICALAAGIAALLVAGDVCAQSRASDLFREGRQAAERGDWVLACTRYAESLSLENSVGALINLGECNEKQGKLALALSFWQRGLARMDPGDARRDLAERSIAALDARTPKLVVMVPATTRVFIDGQSARPREPFPVDPGAHKIVIYGDGPAQTIEVAVREGEVLPVDPASSTTPAAASPPVVKPEAPTSEAPTDEEPDDDDPLLVPALVGVGVGAIGAVGFAVTGALFLGEQATVDEECDANRVCTRAGLDAGERGVSFGVANAVFAGVAIVGAGVATTLFVIRATDDGSEVEARVRGSSLELRGTF